MKNKKLGINQFMQLKDKAKGNYINRYYPDGICKHEPWYSEYHEIDIHVSDVKRQWFTDRGKWYCEDCGKILKGKAIGTGDSREPMFHFACYEKINKSSVFIPR